jgi:hypothetical protein
MAKKAIMGRAKCLTHMVEVLNNFRFNRNLKNTLTTYEDVENFIPLIVPMGYIFSPMNREQDNNYKCFLLHGSKCQQVIIFFDGDYDNIELFTSK